MKDNEQKIVKMAQLMLLDIPDRTSITPMIIQEHIDQIISMRRVRQPDWGQDIPDWGQDIDYSVVIDELIRRFSQWIGKDSTLQNGEGHIPWLTAARKQNWIYWLRYREWLEFKLSPVAIDALDQSTDRVLSLLENPQREGVWDRRGLVVGHVQSGKTSHYTGLINKAADAGYKIIIVLAGLHNNRWQDYITTYGRKPRCGLMRAFLATKLDRLPAMLSAPLAWVKSTATLAFVRISPPTAPKTAISTPKWPEISASARKSGLGCSWSRRTKPS